ncbi:NVEALA domain-containing protein [Parabacteroides chinchillae]|uniref:NVEALA protein n=1 Tax=Parabacteroides chinchillae TaxID=871327 RepID=A0A8G2F0V0_9BACT|nr:NVEALA domain-containing protein [Parabacteroides chinchillae]SEF66464.1 NVEALA protein [Parabacteroides chinchillae]
MRTNIVKHTLLTASIIGFILISYIFIQKYRVIKDITVNNVEALAAGEGGGTAYCLGTGSLDCYGFKVERIDYFSLDYE